MSDISNLAAEPRAHVGKGAARAARRGGRVPAVIYGDSKEPMPISISAFDLSRELQQPGFFRRLYDVAVNGEKQRVLAREVQRDPVTDTPIHVDFLRIGAGARIAVAVVVVFRNDELSPGLKRGGVLNVVRHDVELMCPATAIPEAVLVDLEGLEIGDSVHISDVTLPSDVEPTITDRDFTIATVAAPTVVRDEAAAEAAAEEEALEEEGEVEGEAEGEGAPEEARPEAEKEEQG